MPRIRRQTDRVLLVTRQKDVSARPQPDIWETDLLSRHFLLGVLEWARVYPQLRGWHAPPGLKKPVKIQDCCADTSQEAGIWKCTVCNIGCRLLSIHRYGKIKYTQSFSRSRNGGEWRPSETSVFTEFRCTVAVCIDRRVMRVQCMAVWWCTAIRHSETQPIAYREVVARW